MEQGSHTRREQTYTFLLACPDQVSGNADAIMLVTYDVPNQKIGMLSVPRDTLVDESSPKINSAPWRDREPPGCGVRPGGVSH